MLIVCRFTGGLAASLLFSGFECWMVSEHVGRKQLSTGLFLSMFGLMHSTMYLVAIVSGFVAGVVAERFKLHPLWEGSVVHVGGDSGPLDLAAIRLTAGAVLISHTWKEIYGEYRGEQNDNILAILEDAFTLFWRVQWTPLLDAIAACLERARYVFNSNCSPTLKSAVMLILSLFMMACMCGTSVHTAMAEMMRPKLRLRTVFPLGMLSLVEASIGATCSAEDPARG
ncbi:unnamed protein product [Prorocentrum cordatum]|uniref:H(+)-exporting diphosphatase n=1 Tax=Prorocentrum cordatum TaxID=2364126 RepID=A0ABN9R8E6_9DINO|nr:unnamed protein product [Polarella glacialis]